MGPRSQDPCRFVRQATLAQIEDRLAPALPADLLKARSTRYHCRQRIFTLSRTFWGWLWQILQANTSCRAVVRQVQALFALEQGRPVDPDTGAYCQARRKVLLPLLKKVFAATFRSAESLAPPSKLLQGRPLRVADGSGARLADTPANRKAFPPSKNQAAGVGFPYLRIVALFSACSGAILARATGSLGQSELQLFVSLLSYLKKNDVVVGDRAYGNYLFAALFPSLDLGLIGRLNACRKVDFREALRKFSPQDALFIWDKPARASVLLSLAQWVGLPQQITVRIIRHRITQKGFRTRQLTLVTTLLDPQLYPAPEILEAYAKRWRMELCLDDLKTTLGMELLTCRSPCMVQKELLMFLCAHNFLRWIMAQAAQQGPVDLERVSFKGTMDAFREWSQAIAQIGRSPRDKRKRINVWQQLLETLAADLVPERPGRLEPHAVKNCSKYPKLTKPRHQYVDRLSRNERRRLAGAKKRHELI